MTTTCELPICHLQWDVIAVTLLVYFSLFCCFWLWEIYYGDPPAKAQD